VYASIGDGSANAVIIVNPVTGLGGDASPFGFGVDETSNNTFSSGTWAVTAP
jgi:hypothetical protein